MKIALLTTYFALGADADSGIGQHFRVLADALANAGHEVHVFYLAEPSLVQRVNDDLAKLRPAWHCRVIAPALPAPIEALLARSWPARQVCRHLWSARAAREAILAEHRKAPFDIVETHGNNVPAFFLLRSRRRPPVLTRVSTTLSQMLAISPMRSRVLRWAAALERYTTGLSDALVTHTRQHRDTVCSEEGFEPARFELVPHGLPDPGPPPPQERGPVEFLFVGRFEARKGIDVLLHAIPAVAAACPDAIFTLAGSRGEDVLWSEFSRAHPTLAGGRVRAPGRVSPEELGALYRRCAILVAPSRYESFGLIYVEAMSHGKPVIGCRAGGIPDVVDDGVTGLLAAPGDAASLADCMVRLGRSETMRLQMGLAARDAFVARFSASILSEQSVACYQRVISRLRKRQPV